MSTEKYKQKLSNYIMRTTKILKNHLNYLKKSPKRTFTRIRYDWGGTIKEMNTIPRDNSSLYLNKQINIKSDVCETKFNFNNILVRKSKEEKDSGDIQS